MPFAASLTVGAGHARDHIVDELHRRPHGGLLQKAEKKKPAPMGPA
jgi:hypothetical protein